MITDADATALDQTLDNLAVGWRAFACAAAEGRCADAEHWAAFVFVLWAAAAPLDPPLSSGWCARAVALLEDD